MSISAEALSEDAHDDHSDGDDQGFHASTVAPPTVHVQLKILALGIRSANECGRGGDAVH
jgi:hypothetical protein